MRRIIALAITMVATSVVAQQLHFENFNADHGLPSSEVYAVHQDASGQMWFATDHGLSKYDGYTFHNFGLSENLPDLSVLDIHPQENGRFWCTTFSGQLFHFDPLKEDFTLFEYSGGDSLKQVFLKYIPHNIYVAENEEIYVSLLNALGLIKFAATGEVLEYPQNDVGARGRVGVFEGRTGKVFSYGTSSFDELPEFDYTSYKWIGSAFGYATDVLVFPNDGAMAIHTNSRASLVTPEKDTMSLDFGTEAIAIGMIGEDQFWVGYMEGGVRVFDTRGNQISHWLNGESVTALETDKEDGIWITTLHSGIFHTRNRLVSILPAENQNDNWVYSLAKDDRGQLHIGHYNGAFSRLVEGKVKVDHRSSIRRPTIVFNVDSLGVAFSSGSGIQIWKKGVQDTVIGVWMSSVRTWVKRQGKTYVAGYSALYEWSDTAVTRIALDRRIECMTYYNGQFYAGTRTGLMHFDPYQTSTRRIGDVIVAYCSNFETAYGNHPSLQSRITDLQVIGGTMFASTRGAGLVRVIGDKVLQLTKADGLVSDEISKIYAESESEIWLCTNHGLSRLSFQGPEEFQVSTLSYDDGLPSNEVTTLEIIHDTIWVGTRRGLCWFPRDVMDREQQALDYNLRLTTAKVNDRNLNMASMLDLSYDQNRVEFGFKAISFKHIGKLQYRYKLKGADSDWTYTTRRSALYSSLSPGNYEFIVQVRGDNQEWGANEARVKVYIAAPYWQTIWFRVGASALIVLVIYLFFRYRILTYNRDIIREMLRQLMKRMRRETQFLVVRESGKDVRIATDEILFVKASGNYLEIHTEEDKHVVRYKIGEFLELVPDPLEFLRIRRSYIVRIDKVEQKGKKEVVINGEKISVGETYLKELEKIKF